MEDLIIYKGDTFNFRATITEGLSPEDCALYTSYVVAKEDINGNAKVLDLSTNTWDASTAIFTGTSEDSQIDGGPYQYENYVSNGTNTFTVGQGTLHVRKTYR